MKEKERTQTNKRKKEKIDCLSRNSFALVKEALIMTEINTIIEFSNLKSPKRLLLDLKGELKLLQKPARP